MNLFSFLAYAVSDQRVVAPDPREDLKVVSYNIRYYNNNADFGNRHWFVRAKYVLTNIERLQPDILCLQEVHPPSMCI